MKRFLYSHPLLATTLFTIGALHPLLGIFIPFVLVLAGVEMNEFLGWALLIGSLVYGLLLAIFPPAFASRIEENLHELRVLKRDRKAFHAPNPPATVKDAQEQIEQNLEKRLFTKSYCKIRHTQTSSCVGVWKNETVVRYRGDLKNTRHPIYYLLYTTDQLEESPWNELKDVIDLQLLESESEGKYHNYGMPAYAVCILCNDAPFSVTEQVHRIQWESEHQTYLCIGIVPKNDWHLSTYKSTDTVSKLSRKTLGKGTFGLKTCVFPYKGNREYTNAFYQKVDQLCGAHSKKK